MSRSSSSCGTTGPTSWAPLETTSCAEPSAAFWRTSGTSCRPRNSPSICEGGVYEEGTNTYTEPGTFIDVYSSINGCDSTVTTILSVASQFEVTNTVNICEGESYTEGTTVYNTSGTYENTYPSTIGCDSVVTTILAVSEDFEFTNTVFELW